MEDIMSQFYSPVTILPTPEADLDDESPIRTTTTADVHVSADSLNLVINETEPIIRPALNEITDSLSIGGNEAPVVASEVPKLDNIVKTGINHEEKQKIIGKYAPAANCSALVPPILNEEIDGALTDSKVKEDRYLQKLETQISAGLMALYQPILLFISEEEIDGALTDSKVKEDRYLQKLETQISAGLMALYQPILLFISEGHPNNVKYLENLADSLRLTTDLWILSQLLNPQLKKFIKQQPINKYLYGENLLEKVKQARATKTASSQVGIVKRTNKQQTEDLFFREQGTKRGKARNFPESDKIEEFRESVPPESVQQILPQASHVEEQEISAVEELNKNIPTPHFKLKDFRSVLKLVTRNCYIESKTLHEFNMAPFGLNIAPFLFTKILKPLLSHLRNKGFMSIVYQDDWLLLSRSIADCKLNTLYTIKLIASLGFTINIENTVGPSLNYSWVYIKHLEREKWLALARSNNNYNAKIVVPGYLKEDFSWWTNSLPSGHKNMKDENFLLEIFTDASRNAWGAHCQKKLSWFWDEYSKAFHINQLELIAALYGLECFAKNLRNYRILLRINNTTSITCINKMGSIQYSHLNKVARDIWQWCEERKLNVYASYVSSKDNKIADLESQKDKHIVSRYFKGIYNLKPLTPKYSFTWDPCLSELVYLEKLYPLEELSSKKLSHKQVEIRIPHEIKTSGKSKSQPILHFPFFIEKPQLCVASTICHYLEVTKTLTSPSENRLILTIKKPHRAAPSQSSGRRLKNILTTCGIDTKIFKGYSTRHAATSAAARAGLDIYIIGETAGWTRNSEVFNKFYHKPLAKDDSTFAKAVLEKLQGTLVYKGLPSCSTPIKSKCQPMPTSNEQDDYSRFVKRLECTGMALKLRGSETPIRGVISGHMVILSCLKRSFKQSRSTGVYQGAQPPSGSPNTNQYRRPPFKMITPASQGNWSTQEWHRSSEDLEHESEEVKTFFIEKPQLCVASTICHYLEVTKTLRSSENTLILTIKKPHRAASSQF
nr:unnamed protein product [Callosobruchus chinensis]